MFRKIIASLCVLFSFTVVSPPGLTQQQWVLIGYGNNNEELFVDRASIRGYSGRGGSVVVYLQYIKDERENRKYYYSTLVDCQTFMFAIINLTTYEFNSGRLLESVDYGGNAEMKPLIKDSLGQKAAILACKK
ncbi:hypothetical protein PCC9214_04929 [Planktothrix tepida]|uniref:Surface-adhesin protein E-like domain-containing protein n=1 Tax=Planktothrix tepida PCC 9214 TaxID=671072 RepID=A0A1J1LTM6_9CYAN|nr:surface-adhesin E family protein [Planktothrix tepida]CAD5982169.1 hypothetical protein PCC9214_04929 [Planktothrix tepida]CUR35751.1 exported hypothetical protein [Planktothrix tepida PCC 9214]